MFPHARLPRADRDRILRAVTEVIESGHVLPSGNPFISDLEERLRGYLRWPDVITTGSGSMALLIALRVVLESRGKVITSVFSYSAAAAAIIHAGCVPSFVDINADTLRGDENEAVTKLDDGEVVGILPVHMSGGVCDWTTVREKARTQGVKIIDDSAQRLAPSAGLDADAACYSLAPTKAIVGYGEAGAIGFHDASYGERARSMARNGNLGGYHYSEIGYNGSIDGLIAAICAANLAHVDAWDARRHAISERYSAALGTCPMIKVIGTEDPGNTAYRYSILVAEEREALVAQLRKSGFEIAINYPAPLHLEPCFADLGYRRGDFPVAERVAEQVLTLPSHPWVTNAEADELCDHILAFLGS